MREITCYHCGNKDRELFEDNGARGVNLSYVCVAPVSDDNIYDHDEPTCGTILDYDDWAN